MRTIVEESFSTLVTWLFLEVFSSPIVGVQQVRSDPLEELDVVVTVELGHLLI